MILMGKRTVVVGIGNPIMGDDGVGIVAMRMLREKEPDAADYLEAPVGGLQLMEMLCGYEKAVLIDCFVSERCGEIRRLSVGEAFADPKLCCPHDTDFGTALALAKSLSLPLPDELVVYAVGVADDRRLSESLSPEVEAVLPELIDRLRTELRSG